MPLVTTKELLKDAQKHKYAIGAFNAENLEMVQAIVQAAEELQAPVIIQTTPSTVKYADLSFFLAMVQTAAQKATVPVAMHLDHGNSFDLAMQALRCGYTSIMIDGSAKSFQENIEITKSVVDACHPSGIPVEAELGKVGGKEDDLEVSGKPAYTDPIEAKKFVEETGVDSLAVAIGTAHGFYKSTPVLDIARIEEISQAVDVPLVLHGTSGVPDEAVQKCIQNGMCKVNYATDLRAAFTKGVSEVLEAHPETIDPKKYSAKGRDEVRKYVSQKIHVCGSCGKALNFSSCQA